MTGARATATTVPVSTSAAWSRVVLKGLERVPLSQRFECLEEYSGRVLVWYVRPQGLSRPFMYGIAWKELGPVCNQLRAERRLRALAEAELRKDLYFFLRNKRLPDAFYDVVFIDSNGRRRT